MENHQPNVLQVDQFSSNQGNQLSNLDPSIMITDNVDWSSFLMNSPSVNNIASDGDQFLLNSILSDHNQSNNGCLGVENKGGEEVAREEFDKIDNISCNKNMIISGGSSSSSSRSRKARAIPRFAFKTRSSDDILDDGYRWRKYGQKSVKNSVYPRSYYRCTHLTCNVKKQVQRLSKDSSIVVTTYEGVHNHPCEKLMEALSPLLNQMQFLSSLT